jgi:hypothetical protein
MCKEIIKNQIDPPNDIRPSTATYLFRDPSMVALADILLTFWRDQDQLPLLACFGSGCRVLPAYEFGKDQLDRLRR